MRVGYADHAGVAGRRGYAPATQARCDGEGEGLHTKRSLQEGKGKTDALTLLSQAYFLSAVKVKLLSARKRDLTEIEYPLLVKRVFAIPLPATAATPLPPTATAADASRLCRPRRRRRPSGLRARYAGSALRRGGRDFTPNAVSKRVRAKLMPLPSYRKRIFRSAVKVKPFGRASATLTEIEYPLLVKRVFKPSPSPPPRLRR